MLKSVITGGQTGVDRGALDAALSLDFPCGGWCPAGREAEDGPIPGRYPLKELANGGYKERTVQNVLSSDGTLIIYHGTLSGGTQQTQLHCIRRQKPYKLIDAREISLPRAIELALEFIQAHSVSVLNVAGPRESGWSGAAQFAEKVVRGVIQSARKSNEAGKT